MKNKSLLLVALAASVAACQSLPLRMPHSQQYFAGDQVLYQKGQIFPDFSGISEERWQEMAQSPIASVNRIYATLVVKGSSPALAEARKYLLSYPGNLDAMEALARILYLEKKLGLARHYARYILLKDSSRGSMYNILALVKLYEANSAKDFRAAELLFDKANSLSPNSLVSLINLGFMYLEMGALQRAESTFLRALESCNSCSPAMLGIGITYSRLDQREQAISYFRQALRKSLPDRTRYKFYYHLALILRSHPESSPEALELLTEIVDNLPPREYLHFRSQALISDIRHSLPAAPSDS